VPRLTLQQAIRLVAGLAGWRGAPSDGEPGAESVEVGLRRLTDRVYGWKLRAECILPLDPVTGPTHDDDVG